MTAKRAAGVGTLVLTLAAGGCSGSPRPAADPPAAPSAAVVRHATYPVGLRVLPLRRGADRPLTTLVFYPATPPPDHSSTPTTGHRRPPLARVDLSHPRRPADEVFRLPGAAAHGGGGFPLATVNGGGLERHLMRQVRRHGTLGRGVLGARPAEGRFPLVVFSHGLSGSPEWCAAALAAWASAGFVVAAPTFPYTSEFASDYRRGDIVNQPDDVRYVIDRVRRLGGTPGDPLHGRIAGDRVAAVGHSAGGYTTTGLFTAGHDPRLRAGVILAGWAAPGAFAGPPAAMFFVQGGADPLVPATVSRATFGRVPWPKSYLLMRRLSHADYLRPGQRGYARVTAAVTAFLRWTLSGDAAARRHLPPVVPPPVAPDPAG